VNAAPTKPRTALYLRVSTGEQTTENQRPVLEQMARQRGFRIVAVFDETMSAAKERPEFDRFLQGARKGDYDALLVWSLDRFGRSMAGNMAQVVELDRLGVRVVSSRESWLDMTSDPLIRMLLVAIFSFVAEQERRQIVERTRAGMARARAQGHRIGRPHTVSLKLLKEARAMRAAGHTVRQICVALKVRRSTLDRALRSARGVPKGGASPAPPARGKKSPLPPPSR
jgi:DNA invertase Pin-like site-specific DNA recombinase